MKQKKRWQSYLFFCAQFSNLNICDSDEVKIEKYQLTIDF
ncbi:hypothetical protein bcere0024_02520 [Bacillus cereus Rock4-18]|nr:hypothetical protein bcere0024_02520 [Bacillus cereus Rock4-18]